NNVEDGYVWNLENQGGKRAFRILQKRGKIVDAENFLPIRETYPQHPLSSKLPKNNILTLNELKQARKNETKTYVNEKIKKWEEANPQVFINEPVCLKGDKKPTPTSMKQVKDDNH